MHFENYNMSQFYLPEYHVSPCIQLDVNQWLEGTYLLHLQHQEFSLFFNP
jgi:hypothetical protein